MNADDFRDYTLSFLFLRYLSDNYEAAAQKELGPDYPKPADDDKRAPLLLWYAANTRDVAEFKKQMRRKVCFSRVSALDPKATYDLANTVPESRPL